MMKMMMICCHLWTSQMSEVIEPVHSSSAVIESVNQFMCDHSIHVSLLMNVVLTQNNLQHKHTTMTDKHWHVTCGLVRVFNSPETWQHQILHWPSHHNPRRRNVCLYKVHWEEITYTRDVTLTRAQMCSCVVMVILPAGVFHGPQQKFSVWTWEHTERMNEKRSDLSVLFCYLFYTVMTLRMRRAELYNTTCTRTDVMLSY